MIDLDSATKLAEICSPFIGIVFLGWWMRGQFFDVIKHSDDALASHEKVELERFGKIFQKTEQYHIANVERLTRVETLIENLRQ